MQLKLSRARCSCCLTLGRKGLIRNLRGGNLMRSFASSSTRFMAWPIWGWQTNRSATYMSGATKKQPPTQCSSLRSTYHVLHCISLPSKMLHATAAHSLVTNNLLLTCWLQQPSVTLPTTNCQVAAALHMMTLTAYDCKMPNPHLLTVDAPQVDLKQPLQEHVQQHHLHMLLNLHARLAAH